MNEYRYEELREAAIKNPTDENLAALGEWLQQYGDLYWNGEEWAIDGGRRLRPVYGQEPDEYGDFPLVGYDLL
jgi:hypothetical protein